MEYEVFIAFVKFVSLQTYATWVYFVRLGVDFILDVSVSVKLSFPPLQNSVGTSVSPTRIGIKVVKYMLAVGFSLINQSEPRIMESGFRFIYVNTCTFTKELVLSYKVFYNKALEFRKRCGFHNCLW